MKKLFSSFKLFKLFGVDIKAHWSWILFFFLIIDFSDPIKDIFISILTVLVIFSFVLIHEFGHIFAARKYGIKCSRVVLSFLGGAAIVDEGMDSLPPKRALWVAFAGPLTNLIMFILLIPFIGVMDDITGVEDIGPWQMLYFMSLLINVVMFVFNLLPIYPMDGGRLLRSTLELFKVKHSLLISIWVTMIFCVAIFGFGIWIGSWSMPLIGGLFLFTSFMELRKIKEDKIFVETVEELGEDINNKIKEAFKSHNMSDDDKLNFLNNLEAKALQDGDERIIEHFKTITDEFRKDIGTTGN